VIGVAMSEKEKMLGQGWYVSWDAALVEERERAKDLLFEFNAMKPSMRGERNAILQRLLGAMGRNAWIESPFNCDYGYNITVGGNFYANSHCTILDCAPVTIGDDVLLGPDVSLYTPNHAVDA
jgi:maltose O-acetyltransferase